MAIYRTLGPIVYVDDNVIKTIDRAGEKVDLSPAQAALLKAPEPEPHMTSEDTAVPIARTVR